MKTENTKSFQKFLVIWVGQLISCIGSGLTAFALAVYVYTLTGTAASVSLVTLCAFLPSVLLAPIGGVFADRFDRRLMMILGDLFSAAGLVYMLVVILNGEIVLWQICFGVSVSSIFVALMEPAYKATVTDLLSVEQYARASGMVQIAGSAKYLISPVIAGLLLRIADIKLILSIDIATFFFTISAALWVMRSLKNTVTKDRSAAKLPAGHERGPAHHPHQQRRYRPHPAHLNGYFFRRHPANSAHPDDAQHRQCQHPGNRIDPQLDGHAAGQHGHRYRQYQQKLHQHGRHFPGCWRSFLRPDGRIHQHLFHHSCGFPVFHRPALRNTGAEVLIRRSIPDDKQGRAWGLIGIISQLGYIAAYATAGLLADHVFTPLLMPDGGLASTLAA